MVLHTGHHVLKYSLLAKKIPGSLMVLEHSLLAKNIPDVSAHLNLCLHQTCHQLCGQECPHDGWLYYPQTLGQNGQHSLTSPVALKARLIFLVPNFHNFLSFPFDPR
jgi:hypothetical protein